MPARASRTTETSENTEIKELKQADNKFEANGTLSEFDIKVKECKKKCEIDGNEKEITSAMIYGAMTMVVNGESYKFTLSALDFGKHTKKGDENKAFKGMMTSLGYTYEFDASKGRVVYTKSSDGFIPKMQGTVTFVCLDGSKDVHNVNGSANPTRLNVSGRLGIKESLTQDQSDLRFFNELDVKYTSTNNVGDDKCSFVIEGYVQDIIDEMNSNGGMTGCGVISLIVPDYFGIKVYDNFRVPKEWEVIEDDGSITKVTYNDFKGFAKKGGSYTFNGDVDAVNIGSVAPQQSHHFGASSNVRQGYTRFDWDIKGGSEMDEPYDSKLIDKALAEYQNVLDTDYQRQLKSYQESQAKKNNSSNNNSNKRGLGRPNNTAVDNSDLPFDDAEEENPFN